MRPNFSTLRTKIAVAITTLALVIAGTLIAAPAQAGFWITTVTPATGSQTGNTLVTITNTNMIPYAGIAKVTFGGVQGTIEEKGAQLKVRTPAHAPGAVDIALYDASPGEPPLETAVGAFTYTAVPELAPVTLTGTSASPLKATLTASAPTGSEVVFYQYGNKVWRQLGAATSTGAPIVETFSAAAGSQKYKISASKDGFRSATKGVTVNVKNLTAVTLTVGAKSTVKKRVTIAFKATAGAQYSIQRKYGQSYVSVYKATASGKATAITVASPSGRQVFRVTAGKAGMLTTSKSLTVTVK